LQPEDTGFCSANEDRFSLKKQGFVRLKVFTYIRLSRGLDCPTCLLVSFLMSLQPFLYSNRTHKQLMLHNIHI
jgi:hypothetical protein